MKRFFQISFSGTKEGKTISGIFEIGLFKYPSKEDIYEEIDDRYNCKYDIIIYFVNELSREDFENIRKKE